MNNDIDKLVEHILHVHKAREVEKKFNFKDACKTIYGYLFVDSEDGHCYLFDENGKMDDIRKLKALHDRDVKRDIKKIVIPESIKSIRDWAFENCTSLEEVIFKGKTIDKVKAMYWYPWGIEDKAIIKCS